MPENFTALLRQHLDLIAHAWIDEVYADRRTHLPLILSAHELVEFLPELIDELAYALEGDRTPEEVAEAAARLRAYAQVRFQQGVLIDEMARELTLLRDVLNRFLWREALDAVCGDLRELSDVLRSTNLFIDELLAQAVLVYAASLRPRVRTRGSIWPPPRHRRP